MHTYTVASNRLRILRYFCCTGFVRAKPEGRKTAIGIWTTMICGLWNFFSSSEFECCHQQRWQLLQHHHHAPVHCPDPIWSTVRVGNFPFLLIIRKFWKKPSFIWCFLLLQSFQLCFPCLLPWSSASTSPTAWCSPTPSPSSPSRPRSWPPSSWTSIECQVPPWKISSR